MTENTFHSELQETDESEIQHANVASVLLTLLKLGITDVVGWDYLERPRMDNIVSALEELHVLGAVDAKMQLTPLGQTLAVFPLEPALAKVVVAAHERHVLHDVCAIIAMVTQGNVLLNPSKDREKATKARVSFWSRFGDHLTLRNIFRHYQTLESKKRTWCKEHYINRKALELAINAYKQLVEYAMSELGPQHYEAPVEGLDNDERDAQVLQW